MDSNRRSAEADAPPLIEQLADRLHRGLLDDATSIKAAATLPEQIGAYVEEHAGLLDQETRADLIARVRRRSIGVGPLDDLFADPEVDEILVNGPEKIFVERGGRLQPAGVSFAGEDELRAVIERLLGPVGRRVDESEPLCDARLPDGSRLNVVLPPLAVDGPVLSIRRFRDRRFDAEMLRASGSWPEPAYRLLAEAVCGRRSILVAGGTGSGKTTSLAALAGLIDPVERIVTIEDTAELRLSLPHLVRLEGRPANVEGRGAIPIRALVRNALRMRPDRIVVGEVRGGEALDMLAAMTTGHDGSLSTIHASSPHAALRRLETLALMADVQLPVAAIREQIIDGIGLIVQQRREPDGGRGIAAVCRVVRGVDGDPDVEPLWTADR